jgi:glutamine synthetase
MTIELAELQNLVADGRVDTVICAFPDLYGRLMGKRLDARFFLEVFDAGIHACDYLLTVDMEMEPVDGYTFANWEKGYGDVHLVCDPATLRVASWLDRTAIVLCDVHAPDHEPVQIAPRTMLQRQVTACDARGYDVAAASELEYYLYRTSFGAANASGYRDLDAAGWYLEDYHLLQGSRTEDLNGEFRRHLSASGIGVESTKGEWGKGQHEINVSYASALEMADRHVVLKQCLKEIAEQRGASVTFMAKVDAAQAGSSSHMHISLWRDGTNAFAGDGDLAGVPCSDTFRWFLGGCMAHAAELAACFAPTVNSYKRFQPQSWAPIALAWSPDNRTAGFRVVGNGASLRIECRIPGADVNPYIAFAALVASGLDGIEQQTEPPPPFLGDVYAAAELPSIPPTLGEATERLADSAFAKRAFGTEVVEHYVHFLRTEEAAYRAAVTDWERARYFERI